MSEPEDLKRENEALRGRIATLNAAILRINASLDLDTVFDEVVESARALTGARLGFIVTSDEAGAPDGFVFSGVTPEEQRELLAWPDSVRLFEHLRSLPAPLRLADLGTYVRALGIEPAPTFSRTFQGTPMRHRGAEVGHFFLADKADGEAFTDEDEEVLTLFASQAASAIANARIHRGERRARADLEALVETSPVGVLVFDAESGQPVSFNREARRIAESLRQPGRPPEQLLEVLSFRRADGSEVSLRDLPIDQLLQSGETMRAEEVVLSVPDGRSVRTLINAAPVQGEGGAVASLVITIQDLAPLDEIERMRTEFLGLVSHELKEPLAAIKGSATTLLEDAAALDPAEMREFHRIIAEQSNHMRELVEAHGGRIRAESAGPGTTVTFTLPVAGEPGSEAAAEAPPGRQPAEKARILVVDDDPRTLRSVRDTLSAAGYVPLVTGEPGELAHIIRSEKPRLVLLDLVLPGKDGIALMQEVPELSDLPVIFISGYGRDETVAAALEAGAADYIVKPFSPTELVARVRVALRRREEPGPFVLGDLSIDYGRRRVSVAGNPVTLTATEFKLLRVLALDAGRVVTYETLLRRVWNGRSSADANLVRIFVRTLRQKLGEDAANPVWIFNERGVGYRMAGPGEE